MRALPRYQTFFPGYEAFKPATEVLAPASACPGMKPADVLVVLAHPDDETFLSGTTALLKRKGYSIQFVYATDGDAGWDHTDTGLRGRALGNHRRNELRDALRQLGMDRDPFFLDIPDGKVPANETRLQEKLREIVGQVQPRLVLTFGPDGLTKHPDHISVGKVTDALAKSADVYHIAMTPEAIRNFMDPRAFGSSNYAAWQDLVAIPPRHLAVRIDIREAVPQKMAAIESHRCQFITEIDAFKAYCGIYPFEEFAKLKKS
jgi:LmbE family N-acetylglucosaminyl deacetylase